MGVESLFVTRLYQEVEPRAKAMNAELEQTALVFAREDGAGRRWSAEHGYVGYTSYASLNDLPLRAPCFGLLQEKLDRHVALFSKVLDFDLPRRGLVLNAMWINVMGPGSVHMSHLHPHSVLSGTYYVAMPEQAAALKFEDPRLPMMMAAPVKKARAKQDNQQFITRHPKVGTVLLWESWLKHEVMPNRARGKRISISFNYGWA